MSSSFLLTSATVLGRKRKIDISFSFAMFNQLPVQFLGNALLFDRVHCVKLFAKIAIEDVLARIV